MSWLEIRDVSVAYGVVRALDGVSLSVAEGEIVALVGSNCAGKSTLMKAIMGVVRPARGSITFAGASLGGLAVEEVVRRGVVLVPEGRGILGSLTVRENLRLGAYQRRDARIGADLDQVATRFPILGERLGQKAGSLSGGEQQMLAIGRALMARPRLLLLDEPSLGLSPLMVQAMFRAIRDVNASGTAVLLVEQNVAMAMAVADRAYVLEEGRIVGEGEPQELLARPEIQRAYLGL